MTGLRERDGSGDAPASRGDAQADGRTRDRVAQLLLEMGPSTAAALGERLALSPAAVRRHLDAMTSDGTITSREARTYGKRGRGRPARLFALTDAGHAAGPTAYDDLAVSALRFLADAGGDAAVEAFAQARADELERRLTSAGSPTVADVAALLSDDGYAAAVVPGRAGVQLCQRHCPVQHVAAEFPQLCDAETAALGRVLGTHVQRLATIAHGDGVCTTFVPARPDSTRLQSTSAFPSGRTSA